MGWAGNAPCQHDRDGERWEPTPNREIERCSGCGTLRHTAFVDRRTGQARTVTRTKVRTRDPELPPAA